MARGFRRKGRGVKAVYAASLDEFERHLLVELFGQVETLLDPDGDVAPPPDAATTDGPPPVLDEFDRIVAGLHGVGEPTPSDGGGEGPAEGGHAAYEQDPALRRLLPTGSRTDEEAAAEFRRLTEQGLRQRKVANLRAATAAMADVEGTDAVRLDQGTALAFLIALTDVRLVLASRLGLETDEDAERLHAVIQDVEVDDPFAQAAAIYEFLTWIQETLAECLTP